MLWDLRGDLWPLVLPGEGLCPGVLRLEGLPEGLSGDLQADLWVVLRARLLGGLWGVLRVGLLVGPQADLPVDLAGDHLEGLLDLHRADLGADHRGDL